MKFIKIIISFIGLINGKGMVNAKTGMQMTNQTADYYLRTRRNASIKLGYVRLLDAAPLIVADRLGLFRSAGLDIELSREVGWATIRDKLAFGELDVTQALSPMPFAMRLGIGVAQTEVITGMVLNSNGNAITLSNRLREEGVRDGDTLRRYIQKGYRTRKLVLGVVSHYSSHHFMLCRWLEQYKIDPLKDVIISVIPPEQMVRNLASENIDGFCVGEPWNSLAVEEGIGWCPATSSQIAFGYPEKVLATTERFFAYLPDEYVQMIEVISEACKMCDDPKQLGSIFDILSMPQYLNCAPKTLEHAFGGHFAMGFGNESTGSFLKFSGDATNRPDPKRAAQVLNDLTSYIKHDDLKQFNTKKLLSGVYREDIYDQALESIPS